MKRYLFFTALLISFTLLAQIKITEENSIYESVKPKFDNTKDISQYRKASQFLGLINHKIFGLPLNPNYDYLYHTSFNIMYQTPKKYRRENGRFYKVGEFRYIDKKDYEELISEKYFIVEKVDFIDGGKVTPEKWDEENKLSTYSQGRVNLYVKQVDTNNVFILEGGYNSFDLFLSVDYYEFLKSKIGAEILFDEYSKFKIVDNINYLTPDPSEYKSEDIYKISDLIIEKLKSENLLNPVLKFKILNIEGKESSILIKSENDLSSSKFVYKIDYDKYLEKFKLFKEDRYKIFLEEIKKENAELEIVIQNEIKKLVDEYGEENGEKIYFHRLEPGMSLSMMFDSMKKSYITKESHSESKDASGTWDYYVYKSGSNTYYNITLLNNKIVTFTKTNL